MPAKVYTDKDADLGVFTNKALAVLGYGSQGHAHALNLKDSGCKVIIGLYPGSKSRAEFRPQLWLPVPTFKPPLKCSSCSIARPSASIRARICSEWSWAAR